MGAWSHEPFGNDAAGDWAYDLLETKDLSLIESTLNKAIEESKEYLEAPDGEEAIAAVEVLAKIKGKGTQSDSYTEELDAWVAKHNHKPSDDLYAKAKQVLELVCAEKSELAELWEGQNEWKVSINKLKSVLGL